MDFSSGSMCHSHQKAMINGGSMKECTPFLGAVRLRQSSQPSRQYQMPSSSEPDPLQRATSFGRVFMVSPSPQSLFSGKPPCPAFPHTHAAATPAAIAGWLPRWSCISLVQSAGVWLCPRRLALRFRWVSWLLFPVRFPVAFDTAADFLHSIFDRRRKLSRKLMLV